MMLNTNLNRIRISSHSGIYTLEVEQYLPVSIITGWKFFSQPGNLSEITPSDMGFKITSGKPQEMYPGQIITYKINLFPGFGSTWITEITQVSELNYFIDEQRFGPYQMWHHEHHFQEYETGILMKDKVSYKLPFGLIGRLAHKIFIKRKLLHIFNYRMVKLENLFKRQQLISV